MRARAYAADVERELAAELAELRRQQIVADVYVVGDSGVNPVWAKRLEHDARSRSPAARRAQKELGAVMERMAFLASSGRLADVEKAVEIGQKPSRAPSMWHKLKRRVQAVVAACTRFPTSYPNTPERPGRDQRTLADFLLDLAAAPQSFAPSWRVHYLRADAEADQAIALLARALVAHRVVEPSALGVESADGDYTLHDDPSQSYGAQIYWSFRRRCQVVLDRIALYASPLFPAKTEEGARLFAAFLGDDTTREGRAAWGAETIVKLVDEGLDLVRHRDHRQR